MKRLSFLVGALVLTGMASAGAETVCDVRTYGAKGDGETKDTAAIQRALDDCSARHGAGQGRVRLAGGRFVTGPLVLRSHVWLDVEKGAELLGSVDRSDYKPMEVMRKAAIEPLLRVERADGVTISGGGVIDGRGQVWWEYVKTVKDSGVLGTDHPRPFGLFLDHSTHVTVEDVTIQNSGMWQIVPYYSEYLVFRNLRVLGPKRGAPNTDGLDPFSSSHIVIDHYFSGTGDDNIAIKSGAIGSPGPDAPSTDITITDCTFENGHGLSIGSEVAGGVQHVHAERISFKGTDQGIRVKANRDRGADLSDLTFKDITMDGVGTSILISEYYPKVMPEGEVAAAPVQRLTPHFHNIRIEHVRSVHSDWAGVVVGLPESPVVDVVLKDVRIEAKKGFQVGYATVAMEGVEVKSEDGRPVTLGPQGRVTVTGSYAGK